MNKLIKYKGKVYKRVDADYDAEYKEFAQNFLKDIDKRVAAATRNAKKEFEQALKMKLATIKKVRDDFARNPNEDDEQDLDGMVESLEEANFKRLF